MKKKNLKIFFDELTCYDWSCTTCGGVSYQFVNTYPSDQDKLYTLMQYISKTRSVGKQASVLILCTISLLSKKSKVELLNYWLALDKDGLHGRLVMLKAYLYDLDVSKDIFYEMLIHEQEYILQDYEIRTYFRKKYSNWDSFPPAIKLAIEQDRQNYIDNFKNRLEIFGDEH